MVFAIIAQIYNWLQPPYMVAGAIGPAPEPRKRRWAPCWLGPPGWRASPPADAQAMALANAFRACILPQASGDPRSPAPPHRRQANVFDTQNGSFSNTLLTAYTLTGRGRASSVFCRPRFQGRNITTQGGPQL